MAYLGIDPSTKSTGWAIIGDLGELIAYGVICPEVLDDPVKKLAYQQHAFRDILTSYPVTHISCEDQFFGNNVDTLKKLVQVSSTAILISIEFDLPIALVYPSSWRKVVHGTGKANKKTTQVFVNNHFNKSFLVKENDITDAIGIAYYTYLIKTAVIE